MPFFLSCVFFLLAVFDCQQLIKYRPVGRLWTSHSFISLILCRLIAVLNASNKLQAQPSTFVYQSRLEEFLAPTTLLTWKWKAFSLMLTSFRWVARYIFIKKAEHDEILKIDLLLHIWTNEKCNNQSKPPSPPSLPVVFICKTSPRSRKKRPRTTRWNDGTMLLFTQSFHFFLLPLLLLFLSLLLFLFLLAPPPPAPPYPSSLHLRFYWFTLQSPTLASPHRLFSLSSRSRSRSRSYSSSSSLRSAQFHSLDYPARPFHADGRNWEEKATHLPITTSAYKYVRHSSEEIVNPLRQVHNEKRKQKKKRKKKKRKRWRKKRSKRPRHIQCQQLHLTNAGRKGEWDQSLTRRFLTSFSNWTRTQFPSALEIGWPASIALHQRSHYSVIDAQTVIKQSVKMLKGLLSHVLFFSFCLV